MNKKILFIIGIILIISIVLFMYIEHPNTFLFWQKVSIQELSNYSNVNCSKPIKVFVRLNPNYKPTNRPAIALPDDRYLYEPVDPFEAKLFCRSQLFIESEGILKVLQRPEVLKQINKYQYKEVSVVALKFGLIKDKDFVNRLLPTYKGREIGCIIIVETPGEKKVYLEDEKLQAFEELDYSTFSKYLNNASPTDKQLFTENLH